MGSVDQVPRPVIDLRSDTVTRPTAAMRAAIAAAPVGDDQFGEDPSINALQERVAALLGKEAALWLPTGTMSNQVALRLLTRPGDDVMLAPGAHIIAYETGAGAANSGVQFTEVGQGGVFTAEEFLATRKPVGHPLLPPTMLVVVENTHNRAGGVVFPQAEAVRLCAEARQLGVSTFLDGSRLWNAAAASGLTVGTLAAPFDLVSVALSKGLGAPGGSLLAGSRELISRAVRYRRMFGGAMRQVGLLGAAGLHALDHHLERLPEDHTHAQLLAERLGASPLIQLNPAAVQTNIVLFHLAPEAPDAATVVARALEKGVRVIAFGPRTIRAVTHLDVTKEECLRAADILAEVVALGT